MTQPKALKKDRFWG